MRRRSLLSAVLKMSASWRQAERRKNNSILIASQGGNEKEKVPRFELNDVDFDYETRIAKIHFTQITEYRTIDRYVTQNYVRYPIYSAWKTKRKSIVKTIKLTNAQLEMLNVCEDNLIRKFADDIIIALDNEDLLPSWFIIKFLRHECEENNIRFQSENDDFVKSSNNEIEKIRKTVDYICTFQSIIAQSIKKIDYKTNIIQYKLNKISNAKHIVIKAIFTFGIYLATISKKRVNKLNLKLSNIQNKKNDLLKQNQEKVEEKEKYFSQIIDIEAQIKEKDIHYKKLIEDNEKKYAKKIASVTALQESVVAEDEKFIPLKSLCGMNYEKIIGCYVIHNKEKDKYYVGQSKDVMKRLRQHFKGTVPNNSVFAEDYYLSNYAGKNNLFEIMILPCDTKDELDKTEKFLIEKYDSFRNGYNSTAGNK